MTTREQLTAEKLNRLLEMIADDGATQAGEIPPREHVVCLLCSPDTDHTRRVAQAHREGRGPPEETPANSRGRGQ